jgi:predicted transcriptional regulator
MAENDQITKSFSLDHETVRRLEILATTEDRSASAVIRRLINRAFDAKVTIATSQPAEVSTPAPQEQR